MYRDIANGDTPVMVFLMVSTTDGTTAVTGITPSVEVSKNGGAFAAATNSVSEISDGWYKVTLTATETNTNGPLILRATGTGAYEWRDTGLVRDAQPDVNVYSIEAGVVADANVKTVDATFDGSNFVFDATALEQVAVYLIRYALANIENSGKDTVGGVTMPTKNKQSLAAAIARLVNDFAVDEINEVLTVYETDGVTEWLTQDITSSATAKPLTSGTTN